MNKSESAQNHADEVKASVPEDTAKKEELSGADDAIAREATSPAAGASELQAVKLEMEKYKDLALRCQAELDNFRKRIVREKEDAIRYANAALLERLLPIVDNFELGLEAAKNTPDASSILLGMGMVQKQLIDFLKENGVQAIEAVGCLFDPNLHDAVSHEYSDEVKDGYVIRQTRRGYKLRDRLLRPSTVVVSKGAANS
ncbi:MAG: nucleotide exchange factor GrpE [Verrucomicrobia bacterium]|nr:MAG: nucleotide exchange factor GrpE [Verrucomicrobiota bacterium]